jgi:hypothetical protein
MRESCTKQELAELFGIPVEKLTPEDISSCRDGTKGKGEDNKRSRLRGWKLSELGQRPDPVWILTNTVPAGFTVVYGQPKAGKSFWCIELVTCFATGKPFHGATLGKSGRVLYVAAEGGGKAIYNRIMAVASRRGIAPAELVPPFLRR